MKLKAWQIVSIIFCIFVFSVFFYYSFPIVRQVIHKTPLEMKAEAYLEDKYKINFRSKKMSPERTMYFGKTGNYYIYLVPSGYKGVAVRLFYDYITREFKEDIVEWGLKKDSYNISYYTKTSFDFWTYAWSEEISKLINDDVLNYFGDCYFCAVAYVNKSDYDSIYSLNELISFRKIIEKYGSQNNLCLEIHTFGRSPDEKKLTEFREEIKNKYNISFEEIEIYYRDLEDKTYFDDYSGKGHSRYTIGEAEDLIDDKKSKPIVLKVKGDKIEIEQ